jgi:hypothetical protein
MSDETDTPRVSSTVSRRRFLGILATAGAGGGAGLALGQMMPASVSGGGGSTSGIDPPSYQIFNNNGTIIAVNGATDGIDFSGLNATTVVQQAINNLTNGSLYVKEGVGTLGTLTHKPGVMVMQETQGSFRFLNGSPAVKTKAGVPADTDFGTAVDGLLELNTSTGVMYERSSGVWQPIALVKTKAGVPVDGDFGTGVDGLLELDTSNGLVYQRVGGVWNPLAVSQVFGQSSGTNPIVVYDVPSLISALANITNAQRIVILPGIYNIGTTTLTIGTSGQVLSQAQIFGLVSGPAINQPTGVCINYSGTGSAVKVNANLNCGGETFLKNIGIYQSSGTQQGNGLELAGYWHLASMEDILVNNFANGFYFSSSNLAAGTGGSQWNRFRNLNAIGCGYGYRIPTGVPINRNIFTECWAQNFSISGIRMDPSANGQGGGCFGVMWIGGYLAGGPSLGAAADLNSISNGGNNVGDFTFLGVDFSNSPAEINVGQPGMHARAIGCTTKHGGDFVVTGTGTCDVISCFETNTGNIITKRYGNPPPSAIAVGLSPFTFINSVPGANGQYSALIIYWYGGTVSGVTVGGVQIANSSPGVAILQPGDSIVFTYSSAPTVVQQPRLAG